MSKLDLKSIVRPNILNLKPYSSARDEYYGNTQTIYLDANENPLPERYNRYPDPHQNQLKEKLGELRNIDKECIFIGNGSDEAIDLLIRIFCEPGNDSILITNPTYGMYRVSADINDVGVVKVDLDDQFQLDTQHIIECALDPNNNVKLIFLCSPGNPSGISLVEETIVQILEKVQVPVIVDEAYIDFAIKQSMISFLPVYDNLVVLQTFSKAMGMAGLRLGMAFASFEIISLMDKAKPPYNINEYSQISGIKALENFGVIQNWINTVIKEREQLQSKLAAISIVKRVLPSETNFLMVEFENAGKVYEYLMNKNIIVRDRSKELHCNGCLRITVGTPEENKKLLDTLSQYEKENIIY